MGSGKRVAKCSGTHRNARGGLWLRIRVVNLIHLHLSTAFYCSVFFSMKVVRFTLGP